MEKPVQVESGVQLFARLRKRASVGRLTFTPIPYSVDLKGGEAIEITGNASSGKTRLLTRSLVKILLPSRYEGIDLDAIGARVLVVDTEHKFNVELLVRSATSYFRAKTKSLGIEDTETKRVVEDSLNRLSVLTCCDSGDYITSLRFVERTLIEDPTVALVAIDGISSYYWQDRENNSVWLMQKYLENQLQLVEKHVLRHRVPIIYTKPENIATDNELLPSSRNFLKCRICLHRDTTNNFTATVISWNADNNTTTRLRYELQVDDDVFFGND